MDFVGKRIWFFLLSAIVIAPGIVFLIIGGGLKPGIDFTGGSTTGLRFDADVQQVDLRAELTVLGYEDAIVQRMERRRLLRAHQGAERGAERRPRGGPGGAALS